MKRVIKIVVIVLAALILAGYILILFNNECPPPVEPGLGNGGLKDCPGTPNCVSSQASDSIYRMKPFLYNTSKKKVKDQVERILNNQGKAEIVKSTEQYIHAVYTIPVFGWKDDVEFYFPKGENKIHFRSASRCGKGDLGVNRRRMDRFFSELSDSL